MPPSTSRTRFNNFHISEETCNCSLIFSQACECFSSETWCHWHQAHVCRRCLVGWVMSRLVCTVQYVCSLTPGPCTGKCWLLCFCHGRNLVMSKHRRTQKTYSINYQFGSSVKGMFKIFKCTVKACVCIYDCCHGCALKGVQGLDWKRQINRG